MEAMRNLVVGTSSWAKKEWAPRFYPKGPVSHELLPYYATQFRTLEVDR